MGIGSWFKGKVSAEAALENEDLIDEPEELVSMNELLSDFARDFESDELVRYASTAVANEARVMRLSHDLGTEGAEALARFAYVLQANEAEEYKAGTTASVEYGRSERTKSAADAELLAKRAELVEGLQSYLGEKPDASLLRKSTWVDLASLDAMLVRSFGRAASMDDELGAPISSLAARAGLIEHQAKAFGELTLSEASSIELGVSGSQTRFTLDELNTASDKLDGIAAVEARHARRRIERPVYVLLTEIDQESIQAGLRGASATASRSSGGARLAAMSDGLVTFNEAEGLLALYNDDGFQTYVAHGQVCLMRDNLTEAVDAAKQMQADFEEFEASREAEVEAEEQLDAAEVEKIEREVIEANAQMQEAELLQESENDYDFDDGRIKSAVPIVPGKSAPEPFPSPARQRAKDRQFGM